MCRLDVDELCTLSILVFDSFAFFYVFLKKVSQFSLKQENGIFWYFKIFVLKMLISKKNLYNIAFRRVKRE